MPLPTPVGRQREVIALAGTGHHAVLGTAGSGKTSMAVLRAMHLSHPRHPQSGTALLVTFNNALVQYVRYLRSGTPSAARITVETYHRFARGYLAGRGAMRRYAICENDERDHLISAAVAQLRAQFPASAVLARPLRFFAEEIAWLAGHGIATLEQYQSAPRTGRHGTRIDRNSRDRELIWAVREQYLQGRDAIGRMYDWDDVAVEVTRQFGEDRRDRRYRHVVIDEGQDFSPQMIRSLIAAVPPEGSVTFFGDVTQQIYGTRSSWRAAGLDITAPWVFKENYRNTREVARLALAIARMPYFRDTPDIVEPNEPAAGGPPPVLIRFEDEAAEMAFVAARAVRQSAAESVAILLRTRADEDRLVPHLPQGAVRLHRNMRQWTNQSGVYYGTFHAAKGLEFDTVFIPRCSQSALPDPEWTTDHGIEAAMAQDGRLLYVGVTRARTNLVLSFTGSPSELLPRDRGLYVVQRQ